MCVVRSLKGSNLCVLARMRILQALTHTPPACRPIVHGMLFGSLFGTIFGASVTGSIYASQSFKFQKPVFVDETITARITVTGVRQSPHLATCETVILKADGSVACKGEAVVLLPAPTGTPASPTQAGAPLA